MVKEFIAKLVTTYYGGSNIEELKMDKESCERALGVKPEAHEHYEYIQNTDGCYSLELHHILTEGKRYKISIEELVEPKDYIGKKVLYGNLFEEGQYEGIVENVVDNLFTINMKYGAIINVNINDKKLIIEE